MPPEVDWIDAPATQQQLGSLCVFAGSLLYGGFLMGFWDLPPCLPAFAFSFRRVKNDFARPLLRPCLCPKRLQCLMNSAQPFGSILTLANKGYIAYRVWVMLQVPNSALRLVFPASYAVVFSIICVSIRVYFVIMWCRPESDLSIQAS